MKCRGHAVPREAVLKKVESNLTAHSAAANFFKLCTLTLQNKAFFNGV